MKFRILILLAILTIFGNLSSVFAQTDAAVEQITSSPNAPSFAGGMSGDGRFVVFESTGNVATENPRNADGNREIFLYDYAQRRIFQITDTKILLNDATMSPSSANTKVNILNLHPTISNDGLWIVFGSNATYAFPGDGTNPPIASDSNPGNFDANSFTDAGGGNNLVNDGNTEMWLYAIPATIPVDLSSGMEVPFADLSAGTFIRATNTTPSALPVAGSTTTVPFVADDNREASINDDGNAIAFMSNRNLVPAVGNAFPAEDNDEIFTYIRSTNVLGQVTKTPRGSITARIFSLNPTISGNGSRVAFASNGDNPIFGMTGGSNADKNLEIFFSDLDANGMANGTKQQVTQTARVNAGDVVNTLNQGRRMSRDGRYIAFDSFADIAPSGTAGINQPGFALYLYDTNAPAANAFRQIGPRSNADAGIVSNVNGFEINRYPGFTDYDASGTPQTLVLATRENIKADGTVPANAAEGLNPDAARPPQIYSFSLNAAPTFNRITRIPPVNNVLPVLQSIVSNSLRRITFSLGAVELGTGNSDLLAEVYYLLTPTAATEAASSLSVATGASLIPVSNAPVSNPPPTPFAVQGVSPAMLAVANFDPALNTPTTPATNEGSFARTFNLPIELGGVSMTINGVACGLKAVEPGKVTFIVPQSLALSAAGTSYPVVVNSSGIVIRGTLTIVAARPDVFVFSLTDNEGNFLTNRPDIFNATNRVLTREAFNVTTFKYRGGRRVPTVLRLLVTGVEGAAASAIKLRIGNQTISGEAILTPATPIALGIYTVDFTLPPELNMAGEVPLILSVDSGGVTYESRSDDSAPRFRIL